MEPIVIEALESNFKACNLPCLLYELIAITGTGYIYFNFTSLNDLAAAKTDSRLKTNGVTLIS